MLTPDTSSGAFSWGFWDEEEQSCLGAHWMLQLLFGGSQHPYLHLALLARSVPCPWLLCAAGSSRCSQTSIPSCQHPLQSKQHRVCCVWKIPRAEQLQPLQDCSKGTCTWIQRELFFSPGTTASPNKKQPSRTFEEWTHQETPLLWSASNPLICSGEIINWDIQVIFICTVE